MKFVLLKQRDEHQQQQQQQRVGSMTGSFHKPKEEAAGEPRESLAKRRARAKTMENLASGR